MSEQRKAGERWGFLRTVLARGAAIEQDHRAGKFSSYEAYSARMDAAARELADQWPEDNARIARLEAALKQTREALGACLYDCNLDLASEALEVADSTLADRPDAVTHPTQASGTSE